MENKIIIDKEEYEKLISASFLKEKLQKESIALKKENEEYKKLINYYEELLQLNKDKIFGRKSEKTETRISDINIFNEAEMSSDKKISEYKIEEIEENYKIKNKGEKPQTELIEYNIPKEKQKCDKCGNPLYKTKTETRDEIVIIPAKVFIKKHKVHIYCCKNCEKTEYKVAEIKAESPEPLIKGSLASAEAIAHIINEKYVKSVPLYRQSMELSLRGVSLSRQTMSNWILESTDLFLMPIYNILKEELIKREVLHADETVLQVLREPGKKAKSNSYIWLYRTSKIQNPIIIYDYKESRSKDNPKKFLNIFKGYLHTDGYSGYHSLNSDIIIVGCWAHARRKFIEALKMIPKENRKGSNTEKGFLLINKLFRLERKFKDLSFEERHKKRSSESIKTAEELFSWAKTFEFTKLPKSLFKTALGYLISQETYLMNVFKDGRLELSNNRAERSIKPFVIGRKNWLFCTSQKGAQASAAIYSLIETAKENDLSPYKYIQFLLKNIPDTKNSELINFMPWTKLARDNCQVFAD